ncbi:hypothetical protein [Xanthocytophaga flava]|uniref:hypothetical protein n=1 Tax=Xanthocytophaga flava TaxID=3048013 RepID=UPI0028D0DEE1|nr:hypothetical protein [Xanthocytophaga flavus]
MTNRVAFGFGEKKLSPVGKAAGLATSFFQKDRKEIDPFRRTKKVRRQGKVRGTKKRLSPKTCKIEKVI